jgi:UDPglucose 6-dehydrogenase
VRICIVGTGYVGLVSGACFADWGHHVTCVDADCDKIAILNRGELPIYEPGLAEITEKNVKAGTLSFSTDLTASAWNADAVFITVGTPPRPADGHADLSSVYAVAREIAPALSHGVVIVIKSTVPVGTCDEVERLISERRPQLDFQVASNPEFLRAGAAIRDFKKPDRIVIGGERCACERIAEIYRPLVLDRTPVVYTSRRSGELIKYASNAFLATKIAYINEVADICERVGADVQEVAHGMGLDSRIGPKFLNAGPGFGGSCFPKDTLALMKMAEDVDAPMRIVESVFTANERRKRAMVRKISAALGTPLLGKTVALLGLTFKPDTDDMREAPSISLIAGLRDMRALVRAYDPVAADQKAVPRDITCCVSPYEAAKGADVLVVVTEWEEFRNLELKRLKEVMRSPIMLDLRGLYSADSMNRIGFRYYRIGAPQLVPTARAAPRQIAPSRRLHMNGAEKHTNGSARKPKRQRRIAAAASPTTLPA